MIHIALTGERGVGKSTLARKVVEALGVEPGGFITRFADRSRADRTLLIGDGADMRPVAQFRDHAPAVVHEDVFSGYGCALLSRPAKFILMDELGRLEGRVKSFQEAVLRTISGDVPALAVVQQVFGESWLDGVLGHEKIKVIHVTVDNRDALVSELIEHYQNAL